MKAASRFTNLACALIVLQVGTAVFASNCWDLQNQAREAEEKKAFALAERLLRASIEEGEKNGYHNQPCSLEDMAMLLSKQKRYDEAEQFFKRASVVYGKEYPNDGFTNYFYSRYADFYLKQNKVPEAAGVLKNAIALWRSSIKDAPGGDASLRLSEELNYVARWYYAQKQFRLASQFAADAVFVTETMESKAHAELFLCDNLTIQAKAALAEGNIKLAQNATNRAIDLLKKNKFDRQDLEMSELLRLQGDICQRTGKSKEATKQIAAVRLDWPDYVWGDIRWLSATRAASFPMRTHDHWGAYRPRNTMDMAKESLQLASKFPAKDVRPAESNFRIALLHIADGHVDQAEPYLKASLSCAMLSRGPNNPYTAYMLMHQAEALIHKDWPDRAFSLLDSALQVYAAPWPAVDKKDGAAFAKQIIALCKNSLSRSLKREVLPVYAKACDVLKNYSGLLDDDYMDALSDLGHWQEQAMDRKGAAETYRKLLISEKDAFGADSPEVRDTRKRIEKLGLSNQ